MGYSNLKPAAKNRWLSLWQCDAPKKDGDSFPYLFVVRGMEPPPPPEQKKPDAVVVVAVLPGDEPRLLLTSEYRHPIGCREISFPAGIIDEADYVSVDGSTTISVRAAAMRAAVREVKEETGLTFYTTAVSPENLYSSAGMTNESVIIVFGYAEGTPSTEGNEAIEDIKVLPTTFAEMVSMLDEQPDLVFSKVAWPFLWAFKFMGGFQRAFPGM